MTAVAYIATTDFLRRFVSFYVGEEGDGWRRQVMGDGTVKQFAASEADVMPEPSFSLREDQARALLTALHNHFEGGEDTRSLRRDYDAERKRVDKMVDALIERGGSGKRGPRGYPGPSGPVGPMGVAGLSARD